MPRINPQKQPFSPTADHPAPPPISALARHILALEVDNEGALRAAHPLAISVQGERIEFELETRSATRASARALAAYLHQQPDVIIEAPCPPKGLFSFFGFNASLPRWTSGQNAKCTFKPRPVGGGYDLIEAIIYSSAATHPDGTPKVEVGFRGGTQASSWTELTWEEIERRVAQNPAYKKCRNQVILMTPDATITFREGKYAFPGERELIDTKLRDYGSVSIQGKFSSHGTIKLGVLRFDSQLLLGGIGRVTFRAATKDAPFFPESVDFYHPALRALSDKPNAPFLPLASANVATGEIATALTFSEILKRVVPALAGRTYHNRGLRRKLDADCYVKLDSHYFEVPTSFGGNGSLLCAMIEKAIAREEDIRARTVVPATGRTLCLRQAFGFSKSWAGRRVEIHFGKPLPIGREVHSITLLGNERSPTKELIITGDVVTSGYSIQKLVAAINSLAARGSSKDTIGIRIDGKYSWVRRLDPSHNHWIALQGLVKSHPDTTLIYRVTPSGGGSVLGVEFAHIPKVHAGKTLVINATMGRAKSIHVIDRTGTEVYIWPRPDGVLRTKVIDQIGRLTPGPRKVGVKNRRILP